MKDDLEKLFSAIDSVPWPRIEHAFGPATDVPDLIRSLTSPDVNVRNDAGSKLDENTRHQGIIYEATRHDVLAFLALLFVYWAIRMGRCFRPPDRIIEAEHFCPASCSIKLRCLHHFLHPFLHVLR